MRGVNLLSGDRSIEREREREREGEGERERLQPEDAGFCSRYRLLYISVCQYVEIVPRSG
jgi:hypothetical protein